MPLGNFVILHALKCLLGGSEVSFCACIQYVYLASCRLHLEVSEKYDVWGPS